MIRHKALRRFNQNIGCTGQFASIYHLVSIEALSADAQSRNPPTCVVPLRFKSKKHHPGNGGQSLSHVFNSKSCPKCELYEIGIACAGAGCRQSEIIA